MVEKYCEGVVPAGAPVDADEADSADVAAYVAAMDGSRGFLLHEGLQHAWSIVRRGNEFVDRQAPWKLAKDPDQRPELERTLASLVRRLARLAVLVSPFMPAKAEELWTQLGAPGRVADQRLDGLLALDGAGWTIARGTPLFPRPA
jgi:methionyl-tRNA synthetase